MTWPQTVARREVVATLTRQGLTAQRIADQLGVTTRTIHRDRVATGCAQPPPVFLTARQIAEGDRLEQAGVYPMEIARTIGCSHYTAGRRWPTHKLTDHERGVLGRCANLAEKVLR